MSIAIMSKVWELDLPDSEKIVMLALADCANDEGLAWPSMATLARKCSKGERTCQGVIKSLVEKGLVVREEISGKGCKYWVKSHTPAAAAPRKACTPAKPAPPQPLRHTPAAAAPKPSKNHHTSEAKASSVERASKSDPYPMPKGVEPQHWVDFLANRKLKRMKNTATAHKRLMDDLARLADDEWPPGRLIEHAAAQGWAGIYDPRKNREPNHGKPTRSNEYGPGEYRDPVLGDIYRDLASRLDQVEPT